MNISRRRFVGTAGVAAAGFSGLSRLAWSAASTGKAPSSLINGVQIGVITYSFRAMPDQSAEALVRYCIDSGVNAIELMGDPAELFAGVPTFDKMQQLQQLTRRGGGGPGGPGGPGGGNRGGGGPPPVPLTEEQTQQLAQLQAERAEYQKRVVSWRGSVAMKPFEDLRRLFGAAGISIYGYKPSAFEVSSTDAEIDYGMRAAKALGASHVTVELPNDVAQTRRLGDAAVKHGIKVGYHQHTQATPTLWDAALAASPGNGLNLDLGHYVAAGDFDGLAIIKAKHDRITSMHLKDRKSKANGAANLPWGTGDTPIVGALQMMRDQKYRFPASIELEYPVPADSDAVKEVARCLEYCRKALTSRS